MKKIVFNNRTFEYKVEQIFDESSYSSHVTIFYEGEETYTQRKYVFFGEKITKVRPKEVFRIYENADNPQLLKEWWNKVISEKVKMLDRQEEINKGILI